jgi:hypothetical protein
MRGDFAQEGSIVPGGLKPAHCTQFQVGGISVQVGGDSCADVALVSSMNLFRVELGVPDIHIQIERASWLPINPGRPLFDSGSVWRLYEDRDGFQFDFSTPAMGERPYKRLIANREFDRASLLISEECFARDATTAAPLDYPLDELLIMHRLTKEKAIELHGCGIVRPDDTGNLFVGHSGAGKSTTTQLWMEREDVEILSDDRIIVRNDTRGMRMYGTPWHGEAAFASPESAPLERIFILEHGCGNVLTRLSPSQAVAELFARSFVPFHRHEYVDSALQFLQEVVDEVPCYRYSFEPDERAVERILNFRD